MKKSIKKLCVLLLISSSIISSCSSDDDNGEIAFEPVNVEFSSLGQGTLDGDEGIAESNLVIDNESEWNELLDQMDSTGNDVSGSFSSTNVDFENKLVIAVILDIKPNFWTVDVINITENEDVVNVSFSDTGMISGPTSQPYHIVEIPRINKAFVFENID